MPRGLLHHAGQSSHLACSPGSGCVGTRGTRAQRVRKLGRGTGRGSLRACGGGHTSEKARLHVRRNRAAARPRGTRSTDPGRPPAPQSVCRRALCRHDRGLLHGGSALRTYLMFQTSKTMDQRSHAQFMEARDRSRSINDRIMERAYTLDIKQSVKQDRTRWLDDLLSNGNWDEIRKLRRNSKSNHLHQSDKSRDGLGAIWCAAEFHKDCCFHLQRQKVYSSRTNMTNIMEYHKVAHCHCFCF